MAAKAFKLDEQFRQEAPRERQKEGAGSEMFRGVAIFVNGYTGERGAGPQGHAHPLLIPSPLKCILGAGNGPIPAPTPRKCARVGIPSSCDWLARDRAGYLVALVLFRRRV